MISFLLTLNSRYSTDALKSPLVSTSVIRAPLGFAAVYPTNGMKNVTGSLLAVPTGVETKVVPGEDKIEDGDELGDEDKLGDEL